MRVLAFQLTKTAGLTISTSRSAAGRHWGHMSQQASISKFFAAKPQAKRPGTEASSPESAKKLKATPASGDVAGPLPAQPGTASAAETTASVLAARTPASDVAKQDIAGQMPAPNKPKKPPTKLQLLLTEPSWQAALGPEFHKPYFQRLEAFLEGEAKAHTIYPAPENIFRAMNSCPIEDVRVVILGQDPYHGPNQAMGMSFSVPVGQAVPSSLQNIFKEIKSDLGCDVPKHGDLQQWADQGVLLLNNALTVRAHAANSHKGKGWEEFTDAAVRLLSSKRTGLVFLLWGKQAQDKASAKKGTIQQAAKQHILQSVHPSGLSAAKGFYGCKHFSKANQLLQKDGLPPVDWQIV